MSDDRQARSSGDVAPGFVDAPDRSIRDGIASSLIGLVLAAGLTAAAFLAVDTGVIWGPGIPVALGVFAVTQIGVHLVFFLHLTTAPDNTNTALALAFGVLIVILIIAGSIWIMNHLDRNMLPMSPGMPM